MASRVSSAHRPTPPGVQTAKKKRFFWSNTTLVEALIAFVAIFLIAINDPTYPLNLGATMSVNPINVLFLCAHKLARSLLAEAMPNHISQDRFKAYSTGSSPGDQQQPHPLALQTLADAGISTAGLRSKSWDEFATTDARPMDLVITVCNNAAGEVCPLWPAHSATAHWGCADPSESDGDKAYKREAFRPTLHAERHRSQLLVNLPTGRDERRCGKTHRVDWPSPEAPLAADRFYKLQGFPC